MRSKGVKEEEGGGDEGIGWMDTEIGGAGCLRVKSERDGEELRKGRRQRTKRLRLTLYEEVRLPKVACFASVR